MTDFILGFRNTSDAIAGERKLLDAGVDAEVITAPKTTKTGCGICLKVHFSDIDKVRMLLGVTIQGVYPETEEDNTSGFI